MSVNEQLKPCPFCGGEAAIINYKHNGYTIKCTRCLIQKNQRVLHHPLDWLKTKMIEDWNNRICDGQANPG